MRQFYFYPSYKNVYSDDETYLQKTGFWDTRYNLIHNFSSNFFLKFSAGMENFGKKNQSGYK